MCSLSIAFLNFSLTSVLNDTYVHKVDFQHLAAAFSLIVWEEGTGAQLEVGQGGLAEL